MQTRARKAARLHRRPGGIGRAVHGVWRFLPTAVLLSDLIDCAEPSAEGRRDTQRKVIPLSSRPAHEAHTRVVVLGAGFGGLEVTTLLAERLGEQVEVTLVDRRQGFTFGFSKLDVMFGRTTPDWVLHPYRDIVKPGVRVICSEVRAIDPVRKRVTTDAGQLEADVLVLALGANVHPEATPGLLDGGHQFYTEAGAYAAGDAIAAFDGGRVVVGVTSTPFKCPPAPSETALLMHDHLVSRGIRDGSSIALVMPLPVPIPPSPAASRALLDAFAERDIEWRPNCVVRALDPDRRAAVCADGTKIPFDLFLGVPIHRAPAVVINAGLTVDGWVPVDPLTLQTRFPGVYAVGDVTSVGTPKAGVFAERQAAVVAERIAASVQREQPFAEYDGRGRCYVEFGGDQVARIDVTFAPGQAPSGSFEMPSAELAANKAEFGASRARRWFGREWSNVPTNPSRGSACGVATARGPAPVSAHPRRVRTLLDPCGPESCESEQGPAATLPRH
jgi:sulfide:quinone oxidoreductase